MAFLNGWRRLWLVGCGGWLLLLLGLAFSVLPFPNARSRNVYYFDSEVYASLHPDDLRRLGRQAYLGERESVGTLVQVDGRFYAFPTPRTSHEPSLDEYRAAIRRASSGDEFTFAPGTAAEEMDDVTARFEAALRSVVRQKQMYYVAGFALSWFLPSLALYGVGSIVAWVRRGFQGSPRVDH